MNNCLKCNHKFTFNDRFKYVTNFDECLECPSCKTTYQDGKNIYRNIYHAIITFAALMLYTKIEIGNIVLEMILIVLSLIPAYLLFDLLPHPWHRYKKI